MNHEPLTNASELYSVVRRYADAWASGDAAALVASYHDDIVFHYFGSNPLAGDHRGKAACLDVLKRIRQRTDRKLVAIRDVLAGEHYAIVIALERFERAGVVAEVERLLKYTVRQGKLAECWVYDQDSALIDQMFA